MIIGAPEKFELYGRVYRPKYRDHASRIGGVSMSERLWPYLNQQVRVTIWRGRKWEPFTVVDTVTGRDRGVWHGVCRALKNGQQVHAEFELVPNSSLYSVHGELTLINREALSLTLPDGTSLSFYDLVRPLNHKKVSNMFCYYGSRLECIGHGEVRCRNGNDWRIGDDRIISQISNAVSSAVGEANITSRAGVLTVKRPKFLLYAELDEGPAE